MVELTECLTVPKNKALLVSQSLKAGKETELSHRSLLTVGRLAGAVEEIWHRDKVRDK